MLARSTLRLSLALGLVTSALADPSAAAAEDCPKRFQDYGLFLQAKKSCGQDIAYPLMKVMRSCAKATPEAEALKLMDEGRRAWARGVMRSSLGSMCDTVLAQPSSAAEKRR